MRKRAGDPSAVYFEIEKKIFGEDSLWENALDRTGLCAAPDQEERIYWHYCGINSAKSIVSSTKIMLSDLNFMNDSMEGRWLFANFVRRLEQIGYKERIFAGYLVRTQTRFTLGPFVFCLSADGDLLSQWRAYANGGDGLAIGFLGNGFNAMHRPVRPTQIPGMTIFNPVIYDRAVHTKFLDEMCNIVSVIIEDCEKYTFTNPDTHPFIPLAARINLNFYYIEPFFKNPAFSEEREWRLVYFPKSSLMNSWKDGFSELFLSEQRERSLIDFRARGPDLIPYLLFPFEESINSTISHLRLGPTSTIDKRILALFLRKYGVEAFSLSNSVASLR